MRKLLVVILALVAIALVACSLPGVAAMPGSQEEGAAAVSGRYGIGLVDVAPGDLEFDPVRKA